MKESLESEIFPAFAADWKSKFGEDVTFNTSFAGSETVTDQVLQGAPAEVAILSIQREVERLIAAGHVSPEWYINNHKGIVNSTPFVILVRAGNPKGITDFRDLAKEGVRLIHPDPISSGGAQWSILSIYGSELARSEVETGARDAGRATTLLKGIWKNVISTPVSARDARTQFETGYGDALITYELEGIMMKRAGASIDLVIPQTTVFSEHPAALVDRNISEAQRDIVVAFRNFLWTEVAQRAFARNHFRSITDQRINDENTDLAVIAEPLTIEYFGGWERAYPEVIEQVFTQQVLAGK
jgi:ABC-type sulfate transport system, periplasmic component